MSTKIKSFREKKGLSQQQVAEKIGVCRQTFSKIEQGLLQPTLGQAIKLAEIFGVTIEEFLPDEIIETKNIDFDKYKQIITNFIKYGSDKDGKITKTKLAKLCYLLDFAWYYYNLSPITGLEYRKIEFGPVPDLYFTALEELSWEESIFIETKGKASLIQNIQEPKHDKLSKDELDMLKKIANKWKNKTTQDIVDFTHNQLPRLMTKEKDIIPYSLITQENKKNVY